MFESVPKLQTGHFINSLAKRIVGEIVADLGLAAVPDGMIPNCSVRRKAAMLELVRRCALLKVAARCLSNGPFNRPARVWLGRRALRLRLTLIWPRCRRRWCPVVPSGSRRCWEGFLVLWVAEMVLARRRRFSDGLRLGTDWA